MTPLQESIARSEIRKCLDVTFKAGCIPVLVLGVDNPAAVTTVSVVGPDGTDPHDVVNLLEEALRVAREYAARQN